ncbi:MAG: DUF3048 domain-containing protein [Microcella pacifica]|uniref:DUF3048 domain-containing protein n=1 Tax=Microcella pacifica TaxID=2591847 RepID=UPI00331563DA
MRMPARSRWMAAVGVLAALALASGCAAERELPVPTATPEYVPVFEEPEPYALAPLTGEQVAPGALDHPSIAAKIDNNINARPQIGLGRADIVYEILVEGGATRHIAVWHSDIPDEIGPIRSVRPVDPDIVSPLGGIIAYSGGQYRFVVAMQNAPVYNAIHGQADTAETIFRGTNAPAPHNVIVRAPQIVAQQRKLDPPPQLFAFAESVAAATATKEGSPTARIGLQFSVGNTPAWEWNAESERWVRFMHGGAVDRDASGDQLAAVNVVTLRVPVQVIQSIPTVGLRGSGEAWVSTGGATVRAQWSKSGLTDTIRLIDEHGVAVRLAPGNTWVELVPLAGDVSFRAP